MLEHPIKFWEPVLSACNSNPLPSFYIVPDVELLKYFRQNNNKVECAVYGTGSKAYDNQTFLAIIDRSSDMPNARPNYYLTTGHYIVTLTNYTSNGSSCAWWAGYPPQSGKVVFRTGPYKSYTTSDTPQEEKLIKTLENAQSVKDYVPIRENFSMPTSSEILSRRNIIIGVIVLLILVVIIGIMMKK